MFFVYNIHGENTTGAKLCFVCVTLSQMMGQNLRGEMRADLAGAKLCLTDSRFIQVIAKSLSISCKEVRAPTSHTQLSICQIRCMHCLKSIANIYLLFFFFTLINTTFKNVLILLIKVCVYRSWKPSVML